MTNDLAATVAALNDGDRVRATFDYKDGNQDIITRTVIVEAGMIKAGGFPLRYSTGTVERTLTAVEVLAPALPPEPPVGSGVFHDGVLWLRMYASGEGPWRGGTGDWREWADIQPCVPAVPQPEPVPDGWFSFGSFVDCPWLVTEGSPENGNDGLPKWERPISLGYKPLSTDEPDVPVGSLAVFQVSVGRLGAVEKWNGNWCAMTWQSWIEKYGAPVAIIPAGGTA
jgi:hypothetical protein